MKKNILLVAVLLTASFFGQSFASATPPIIGTFAAGSLKLAFIDPTQAKNGCNIYAAYDTNNKLVDFLYVMEDTVNSATTDSCYTFIPFDKNTTQKMATLKNKTNHNEILTNEECIVYHKDKKTSDIEENDMGRNATNCVACKTLLKIINKFYGNN